MDTGKARLGLPANQAYLTKAIAVLTEALRRNLESGAHGTVTVELDIGDGNIRGLAERGQRWWKGNDTLNRY